MRVYLFWPGYSKPAESQHWLRAAGWIGFVPSAAVGVAFAFRSRTKSIVPIGLLLLIYPPHLRVRPLLTSGRAADGSAGGLTPSFQLSQLMLANRDFVLSIAENARYLSLNLIKAFTFFGQYNQGIDLV